MREVDTIKSCQDKMRKTLEQVNHQLGMNRNSRHQLERDLANKDSAISIGNVLTHFEILQGDTSGSSQHPVDIKTKVAISVRSSIYLRHNLHFDVNKRLGTT